MLRFATILILVLLCITLVSFRSKSTVSLLTPVLDLGEFFVNEEKSFEIQLSNSGSDVVIFDRVNSSCGCIDLPSRVEALPRSTTVVRGKINSSGMPLMRKVEKSIYLFAKDGSEPISCRIKLTVRPSVLFSEPTVVLTGPDFRIDGFVISRGLTSEKAFRDIAIESSDPLIDVVQTDNTGSDVKLSANLKSGFHHGYASPIKIFVRNTFGEKESFLLPVSVLQVEVEKFIFPNAICRAVKENSKSSDEMFANVLTGAYDAGWRISSASLSIETTDFQNVRIENTQQSVSFDVSSAERNSVVENSLLVELVRNSERKQFSIPIRIFVFE